MPRSARVSLGKNKEVKIGPRILALLITALLGLTQAGADVAAVSPLTATDAITIPRMLSYQGRLTDTL
ncbi:MAG: hypothetical protein ACP5PK_06260, partial [candidate division WOR-3 bacterium]